MDNLIITHWCPGQEIISAQQLADVFLIDVKDLYLQTSKADNQL
jgi:hypothetical protein